MKLQDYPAAIARFGVANLTENQYKVHDIIVEGSANFTDFAMLEWLMADEASIRDVVNRWLARLEEMLVVPPATAPAPAKKKQTPSQIKRAKSVAKRGSSLKRAKSATKRVTPKAAGMKAKRAPQPVVVETPVPVSAEKGKKATTSRPPKAPAKTPGSAEESAAPKAPALKPTDTAYLNAQHHVKRITPEIKHIRAYYALGETGTKEKVAAALAALQRDIRRGVIGKGSPQAEAIMTIQREYVRVLKGSAPYKPSAEMARMAHFVEGYRVYKSVEIMTTVAGWTDQDKTAAQCKKLLSAIRNAKAKGKIKSGDPYAAEVDQLEEVLAFATSGRKFDAKGVDLSGIAGLAGLARVPGGKPVAAGSVGIGDAVKAYINKKWVLRTVRACKGSGATHQCDVRARVGDTPQFILSAKLKKIASNRSKRANRRAALGELPAPATASVPAPAPVVATAAPAVPAVMSAEQMSKLSYPTYNFHGKWLSLIGEPQTNFKLMVWGEPGMGKSTLSMALARYLASEFGPVLYCSSEEYPSHTLNQKMERIGGPVANWEFARSPAQLSARHKFLVLDSVNHFGWTHEDLCQLVKARPDLSIILVMQATKGGQYRGGKEWEHDMDTVVHAHAPGMARTTKNRFAALSDIKTF